MLKKRIIVRFFALIFSAVLLSQECFLQVPTQWEVKENQTVSFDSRCSLANGSKKTSSFEVSYGSQQVRGYNEEEKNPYSLAGFLKHTAKGALEGAAENAVFYGVEKVFGAAKNVLSCFVAGTLIKTSDGLIPIEEIRVGDEVFAYNIETGETELKEVKQLFVHEENELVHLVINGEKIDTTTNHPFFVEDLGFISAKDLRAGDELNLYDGSTATVESIEIEILEEPVLVYNFEVEDFHTYFVGEQNFLVHNACSDANAGGKAKTGPKPKGTGQHNLKIEEVSDRVSDGRVVAGGGRGYPPEAIIRTPNGIKTYRRPDILIEKTDGSIYGINVGKTTALGAPIKREVEALYDLEDAGIPMWFIGYDK